MCLQSIISDSITRGEDAVAMNLLECDIYQRKYQSYNFEQKQVCRSGSINVKNSLLYQDMIREPKEL